nr:immunoglobulin light chain junction region [Macaca mulatta]
CQVWDISGDHGLF